MKVDIPPPCTEPVEDCVGCNTVCDGCGKAPVRWLVRFSDGSEWLTCPGCTADGLAYCQLERVNASFAPLWLVRKAENR